MCGPLKVLLTADSTTELWCLVDFLGQPTHKSYVDAQIFFKQFYIHFWLVLPLSRALSFHFHIYVLYLSTTYVRGAHDLDFWFTLHDSYHISHVDYDIMIFLLRNHYVLGLIWVILFNIFTKLFTISTITCDGHCWNMRNLTAMKFNNERERSNISISRWNISRES